MKKNIIAGILAITAASAHAAVVTNPTLITGADSIDPTGGVEASGTVTGAATKAALTSTTGFGVIQTFTAFNTPASGINVNYVDFTTGPDIRITSQSYNSSGGGNSVNFASSGSSSFFIGSGGYASVGNPLAVVIEFGSFTSPSTFAADQAVSTVGFMLNQNANAIARTWTATFFDASNEVLSTQSSAANANSSLLFGLTESSNNIRRVELVIGGGGDAGSFIDDLGFAVIPEPSAALLSSLGLLALLSRHRRV